MIKKDIELGKALSKEDYFDKILTRDISSDISILLKIDLGLKEIIQYKDLKKFLKLKKIVSYENIIEEIGKHILKKEKQEKYYKFISIENILKSYNKGESILSFQYEHVNDLGQIFWCTIITDSYFDMKDKKNYTRIFIKDVTYRKKLELSLDSKFKLDKNTGLYNRITIEKMIINEIEKRKPCVMGILSINNIKDLKEKIGEENFKKLFSELADALKINFHSNILLGRISENEIIMFAKNFSKFKLKEKVERIYFKTFTKKNRFSFAYYFKFSVGIGFTKGNITFNNLYSKTQKALLIAKEKGHNNYYIYEKEKNDRKELLQEINYKKISSLTKEEFIFEIISLLNKSCDFENVVQKILKYIKNYFQLDKVQLNLKYNRYFYDHFSEFKKSLGESFGSLDILSIPLILNKRVSGKLILEHFKKNIENKDILNIVAQLISYDYMKYKILREEFCSGKYDKLTGLLNHSSYSKKIDKLKIESLSSLGVLYIDINNFKNINLSFGRKYGDEVLKKIASSFSKYFPVSLKFRLYGDIFFILFEDLTYKKFEISIKEWEKFIDENFTVSISIGKAWSDMDIDFNKLCRNAEEFLRYSKEEYCDKKSIEAFQKIERKIKFMKNLKNGNYKMHLQPKADTKDGEIFGAEALTRLYLDGEVLSPYRFIPQLERDGFIKYLDKYIFEEVCKLLAKWEREGKKLIKISLNFSRATFMTKGIVEDIIEIANRYNVSREHIEIEMTETMGELDKESIKEICSRITKEGFLISLDDFGAKYSNMAVLIYMYFNTVKLDKSLINDVISNDKSKIIIKNIFKICKELGINSIAEGVETEEQFKAVKKLGCDAVQGYLFNKPIPVKYFEELYI